MSLFLLASNLQMKVYFTFSTIDVLNNKDFSSSIVYIQVHISKIFVRNFSCDLKNKSLELCYMLLHDEIGEKN